MATISTPSVLSDRRDEPHAPRWTKEQYYRMGEMGLFTGRRVELIEGEIIEMLPLSPAHATVIALVHMELQKVFSEGSFVRIQSPINAEDRSEPEPDVAVVEGEIRDYCNAHPTTALVVVEVSDLTLRFDREIRGCLYARAELPEYWIVNLPERQLEVYSAPVDGRYTRSAIYLDSEAVSPLAAPEAKIKVADLLP